MADLPVDYANAITPTGALTELPATGPRGVNTINTKINGNYAEIVALESTVHPIEFFHDFTTKPDGAVGANWDSGQPATQSRSPAGVTLTIATGRWVTPWTAAGAAAAYLTAQPNSPIYKFTADFNFNASASGTPTTTQAVGLLALVTPVLPDASTIPNGPMHLVMTQTQYKYQTLSGGTFVDVGTPHVYATPFGVGVNQHVEVRIDQPNSRAIVTGPDGLDVVFTHPNIGLYAANYGTIEIFYNHADTDNRIAFQKMSISTTSLTSGGSGLGPNTVGWNELKKSLTPGTPGPGTFVAVDATGVFSAVVPPGGGAPGTVTTSQISDSGATGRAVVQSNTQADARAAIGVGGATVNNERANVLDYGANPFASGDNVTAFRNAANVTGSTFRPIAIPAGSYNFSTAPFTTGALSSINIRGEDKINTQLNLPAGGGFIDTAVDPISCHISDILFNGGANQLRWQYTGVSVHYKKVIRDCTFYHYTNCAIQQNAVDDPYWNIYDCLFWALTSANSMGIAHAGWPNNNNYYNNSFMTNRVHIKVGRGGPDQKIYNCDFLRFDNPQGSPRIDVWLVPGNATNDLIVNSGAGMTIRDNKFGNEGLDPIDWNCVIADEGSGTWVGDRFPLLSTPSGNWIVLAYWDGNDHKTGGSSNNPLVYSTTPNLAGCVIGTTLQPDSPRRLLHLLTATGFNPALNIVGPSVSLSGINATTLTTAASGTLTGQCPKFLVG